MTKIFSLLLCNLFSRLNEKTYRATGEACIFPHWLGHHAEVHATPNSGLTAPMTSAISSIVDGMMAYVQAMRFEDPRAIPEVSGDFRGLIPARSLRTSGINPR